MVKRKHFSTTELAAALGVSRQRAHQLCSKGQVEGAYQAYPGGPWLIPPNARVVYRKRRSKQ